MLKNLLTQKETKELFSKFSQNIYFFTEDQNTRASVLLLTPAKEKGNKGVSLRVLT